MNIENKLEKALKKLEDIQLVLNVSSIVAITDNRGIITFVNDKFCEISQYSEEELIGSRHNIINSGYHSREFFKDMWRTIGTGNVWKGEIRNQKKDGSYYWVDTTIVPFLKENGKPYQYVSIRHDITKRKEYEERIERMAFYDPLTSLPNRNLLKEWLQTHLKEADRLTVFFIDIDRFKSINDNYGHRIGDLILKKIAKRLENAIQEIDFIARQGGDEFVIFSTSLETKQDILKQVNQIKEQFSLPFTVDGKSIQTTISIGISTNIANKAEQNLDWVETTIRKADTAMYHAKKISGNSHCFNTIHQNDQMERYYQLEAEIMNALNRNEFHIVYQPLINLKTNKISGVEALLRWNNKKLGSISPVEFIPLLEEFGLIVPVGKWVLKTVCTQLVTWKIKGYPIEKVSVNVSPTQFRNNDFIKDVKDVIEETGIEPRNLDLEITEGTILNIKKAEKILEKLRDLGVRISIDDFGTGYSSLSYLNRLPIDTLKIDKSFIHDLDSNDEVIVNTIITMGKNLNFNVIAEGIETEDQLTYLQEQDCHEGQGYYFSKPIEAEEIEKIFDEENRRELIAISN